MLQKSYECLTCHKQIRIAKIDNVPAGQKKKWEKYELDGITLHECHKHPPNQSATKEQPKQQPVVSNDLSKEVAAIKAQLLVLLSRLDRVEHGLQH